MDFNHPPAGAGASPPQFRHAASAFDHARPTNGVPAPPPQHTDDPQFDIFEWYPKYQSCQRYFLDHSQHSHPVQAVAAFVNIHLPYQRLPHPINSSSSANRFSPSLSRPQHPTSQSSSTPLTNHLTAPLPSTSLIPYLRRLVVTGLDFPGVLHGFFGDDWVSGVGPLHEQERRNYLFAAKSGGWASVKKDYDMLPLETVPFLRPLQGPVDAEISAAERSWSEWLAMEDWMVGPRAPAEMEEGGSVGEAANEGKDRGS
ncbi:hypothetical protein MMC06_003204 [Schaereria dolodes]|nr:hypothetical protein [Schaereria dolodes]